MPELTALELETRHEGMGSSDIVEVCGLSPFEDAGPWRIYNAKTGVTKWQPPTEEQAWGHVQEGVIFEWYRKHVDSNAIPAGQVRSTEHDWLWATLDGVVIGANRNIEIKNVGSSLMYRHWDMSSDDGVPMYVRAQVQIGMHVRGVKECHVIASVGGRPPFVWTVGYDREVALLLTDKGRKFWNAVQRGHPPPPDDSKAVREFLNARWPKDERPMLPATAEIDDIGQQRIAASLMAETGEKSKRECDAKLMTGLENARGWEGDGWSFTWKTNKNGKRATRFTVKGKDFDD